jgi:hypothetical protein
MGKQEGLYKFTGQLKGIIGYKSKNDYLVRSAPATVRQSAATKRAARDFGTASKAGKLIRHGLQVSYNTKSTNRLNKALGEIVRADDLNMAGQRGIRATNIQSLNGFQFNKTMNISKFINSDPVINGTDISFPETTTSNKLIAIRAIALSVNFAQQTTRQIITETIILKPGEKLPTLTLNPDRKDITFIMLEIKSYYEVNGKLYECQNEKGYALDIIAVLPPVKKNKESIQNLKIIPQPVRKLPIKLYTIPEGG